MASPLAAIQRSLEPERRRIEDMERRFAELIREYEVQVQIEAGSRGASPRSRSVRSG